MNLTKDIKKLLLAILIGFVIGAAWLVAVRFVTYKSDAVHYHANFALYANGARDEFNSFAFYEEVQSCGSEEKNNPRARAHMHGNVNHVIHVHDNAVTWGDFFANLGYALGDNTLETTDKVYVDEVGGNDLTFMLNGEKVDDINNRVIYSEDVLLINFGQDTNQVLDERYSGISRDAAEYNNKIDPSSCAGSRPLTFSERLKKAIGINSQ